MRTFIVIITLLALTAPAAALCVVAPDNGDQGFPTGQKALLLCQQTELSDTVEDRAAAEQLRAMRAQLQALQLQQQRLQVKPFSAFDLPRF
jgi:hypothetical protein